MKMQVYAIQDLKVGGFANPVTTINDAVMRRMFHTIVTDVGSVVNKYPEDYTVFHIAEFDTETAQFTNNTTPRLIANGMEFLQLTPEVNHVTPV